MIDQSPAREVINEALDRLREKEAKLLRVKEALAETRREIAVLERVLRNLNGEAPPGQTDLGGARLIADLLAQADGPLTPREIADALSLSARGMGPRLRGMVRRGEAIEVPGGFAAPAKARVAA